MASVTYQKSFTLTNSSTELVTGIGAKETLQISNSSLSNTSGSAVTANLNLAGDGAAAATGNVLENDRPIDAKATVGSALTGCVINPGGKLYGYASTTGVVVVHISGIVSGQATRVW